MSRSHKKQPGGGIAVADSDKWFKTSEHRRERRYVTSSLRRDEEPMPRDFGNPCKSAKDGKTYWVDQRSKVDEEISVGSRGRKSMTDLMIDGSTSFIQRPDAPYDLTDAAAEECRAIVASMPPEHFARSHYPMLTQLCRHKVESNRVNQLIEQCCTKKRGKSFDLNEYKELTGLQCRESAAINRLMRSMRLTHQSLYRADSPRPRPVAMIKAPWEPD